MVLTDGFLPAQGAIVGIDRIKLDRVTISGSAGRNTLFGIPSTYPLSLGSPKRILIGVIFEIEVERSLDPLGDRTPDPLFANAGQRLLVDLIVLTVGRPQDQHIVLFLKTDLHRRSQPTAPELECRFSLIWLI